MTFLTIFDDNTYSPPPVCAAKAQDRLDDWLKYVQDNHKKELSQQALSACSNQATKRILLGVFGNSPYLSSLLYKDAFFFLSLINANSDISGFNNVFQNTLRQLNHHEYQTLEEITKSLRVAKRNISLLIAIADITKLWDLSQVTWNLSIFAETCVKKACKFILTQAHKNKEIKLDDLNNPEINSGLVVVAMGKLGAFELNYSSDIDLIVFYEENKINYTGRYHQKHFFISFVKKLTSIIDDRTKDGYVFRTDFRLRPDPRSTPAAVCLAAAEIYYETLGQNWERAAMIKARTIAGDPESCEKFHHMIKPYIWQRSLDFQSIEDIHSIKRQIDAKYINIPDELYGYNIKLGQGGIREIEFFAQTQQLIFGGRRANLRTSSTCLALKELVISQQISEQTCDDLINAYVFYRNLEHRLQMIDDQQTHTLPETDEKMQEIAIFMGFDDHLEFIEEVIQTITLVKTYYGELFNNSPSLTIKLPKYYGNLVFTGTENDPETEKTIKRLGFSNPTSVVETIRGWHHGRRRATRTRKAREILTKLMPILISVLSKSANPDNAFLKFDDFLNTLPSSAQIFALFYSNPKLLDLTAKIMGSYPKIANDLSHNPSLLDYVLAPEFYNALPKRAQLKSNINKAIALTHNDDMETILAAAHNWTNDRKFRVAMQLITRKISYTQSSTNLSRIADITLSTLSEEITRDFASKHGKIKNSEFAIIALGKLGGKELNFGSDLDLVFIYQADNLDAQSDGKLPLNASQYFTRLSRRLISTITSMTKYGRLYEIDIRLRPSGDNGPVASNFVAFDNYYNTKDSKNSAWAWEFMALTRARVITGSDDFREKISEMIHHKLTKKWDIKQLNKGVVHIHNKLKKSKFSNNPLAIKNVDGGLIDLEYIVQYLQLKYANQYPKILQQNTNKALHELRKHKLITKNQSKVLIQANKLFSKTQMAIRITETLIHEKHEISQGIKKTLATHTNSKDFEELQKKLVTSQKEVKKLLDTIVKQEDINDR